MNTPTRPYSSWITPQLNSRRARLTPPPQRRGLQALNSDSDRPERGHRRFLQLPYGVLVHFDADPWSLGEFDKTILVVRPAVVSEL